MEPESPFLRIPPEIRMEIYRMVLPRSVQRKTVQGQSTLQKGPGRGPEPFCLYTWTSGSLSLLAVNRQIRAEALEVFYGTNVFNVIIDDQYPRLAIAYRHGPSRNRLGLTRYQRSRLRQSSHPQHRERFHYKTTLEEVASVSQRVIEITDLPPESLAFIRHVYIVIARETVYAYQMRSPIGDMINQSITARTRTPWNDGSKREYLSKRRALLTQGLKCFYQCFKSSHRRSNQPQLDLEITVFPSREPWGKGYLMVDEKLLERMRRALRRLVQNDQCEIRIMRAVVDTSSWVPVGFTDAPLRLE